MCAVTSSDPRSLVAPSLPLTYPSYLMSCMLYCAARPISSRMRDLRQVVLTRTRDFCSVRFYSRVQLEPFFHETRDMHTQTRKQVPSYREPHSSLETTPAKGVNLDTSDVHQLIKSCAPPNRPTLYVQVAPEYFVNRHGSTFFHQKHLPAPFASLCTNVHHLLYIE